MLHAIARTIAHTWLRTSKDSWRRLPRPTDAPVAHAAGVTPDRVLFVGSGAVVGYGVLSHDLSISGEIARQVSQVTLRGMDADIVADPDLDADLALAALASARISRYDAVVLMLGSIEVVTMFPRARWRHSLDRLLDYLDEEGSADLRVLVVGVPPLEKMVRLPLLGIVAKRCRDINGITETVVAKHSRATYIPLEPPSEDLLKNASRDQHARWAAHIAPSLGRLLQVDAPIRSETVDEGARLTALTQLRLLDSSPDPTIQELVETTRRLFDAGGASFNLIDEERQWAKAATGLFELQPVAIPRSDSFCSITIEQSRLFVIEDMSQDPRYRDRPYVAGPPGLRFYAGYPIEAPSGDRVGSLCIIDTQPRTFSRAEATLLRELALRVQTEVWQRAGVHSRPEIRA